MFHIRSLIVLFLWILHIIQILFGWNDFDNHAQLWIIVESKAFALLNIIYIRYGHIRKLSCYDMTVNKYLFVLFLWNSMLTKENFYLYRYYSIIKLYEKYSRYIEYLKYDDIEMCYINSWLCEISKSIYLISFDGNYI